MSIFYHPEKTNVVYDALSILPMANIGQFKEHKKEIEKNMHTLARLGV